MKIIQLAYSLGSGGAERFIVDLSNQLTKMGHEVIVCILLDDNDKLYNFNKQFLSPEVKFHTLCFTKGFSLKKVFKVCKYIKSIAPDIVHTHLNLLPYIYPLALTSKKIKFYHTLHTLAEEECGIKYQKSLNRYFFSKGIIHPITISKKCQTSYNKFYKLYNAPYINNGRATIKTSEKLEIVKSEIDSYKFDDKTRVYIHVARFSKEKNQELLINAFNKLNSEKNNFILLILGNAYQSLEGLKLQQKACNKIHFLGEKSNVEDYLFYSDAFCLTSIYEGLPISLLEALSAGVTPICTPVGGIPDIIINNEYGFLSKDLSIESYLEAIKHYISHPINKEKLIQYFNDNFSIAITAKKYVEQYNI